jgi:chromosome segregation ATPase
MADALPPRPTNPVALQEQNDWLRRALEQQRADLAQCRAEVARRARQGYDQKQELARLQQALFGLQTGNRKALAAAMQALQEQVTAAQARAQEAERRALALEREIRRLHDTLTQTHGLLRAIPRGQQSPDVQRALGRLRAAVPCLEGNDG